MVNIGQSRAIKKMLCKINYSKICYQQKKIQNDKTHIVIYLITHITDTVSVYISTDRET